MRMMSLILVLLLGAFAKADDAVLRYAEQIKFFQDLCPKTSAVLDPSCYADGYFNQTVSFTLKARPKTDPNRIVTYWDGSLEKTESTPQGNYRIIFKISGSTMPGNQTLLNIAYTATLLSDKGEILAMSRTLGHVTDSVLIGPGRKAGDQIVYPVVYFGMPAPVPGPVPVPAPQPGVTGSN